jgi:hypothetical protein
MAEPMNVHVEVWPVAADETRIWLLSGEDAWRAGPVMADDEPHSEVEYALSVHGALEASALLHSTSWRVDRQSILLTYMAVIRVPGLVVDSWPEARPVSLELAKHVGPTRPYRPTDPPEPRYIDVLLHGLRHLRFLLDTDVANAAALDEYWRLHLHGLSPALAAMYSHNEVPTQVRRS